MKVKVSKEELGKAIELYLKYMRTPNFIELEAEPVATETFKYALKDEPVEEIRLDTCFGVPCRHDGKNIRCTFTNHPKLPEEFEWIGDDPGKRTLQRQINEIIRYLKARE